MRLFKVVILVNFALALGFLAGTLWWVEEVGRLRGELAAARQALKAQPAAEQRGTARGIVRGVLPQRKLIYLTHEDIPGVMPSMTMGFRTEDPKLTRGLVPGDQVQFTVQRTGNEFAVVALRKEGGRR
ncbi:MAG TPA: copper-binding protein [Candidatus Methylomirabilis sp.]|nr:copper-binding protein [Candidatus Methylomirabilis sp.]HSB81543.1 copper-binding protein [Candidatus Methylomirabilis sp.]HSC71952.1 copper-binding protein [Candidatus Methylomirabilis sp.]